MEKRISTQSLADRGYLNRSQLADELGIEPDTLQRWENEGMPLIKKGRVVLYDVDDVVGWMKREHKRRGK